MVGLGGSAGGIQALQAFFGKMPADTGMVFVVILHLSPEHESTLSELLQRTTTMRVVQVLETERVEPNCVYVIPPGKALTSLDGMLRLSELPAERGRRVAVDLFFRTLAETHGPHSIAIVLSGADGDGAIGIKRIKERGGLTIAQDPTEAEHSGMPRSAIATGMVDWVLEVEEIPRRLIEYQERERRLKMPPEEGPPPGLAPRVSADDGETALRDVLNFLRTRTGRDFSCYKRATILRRIARRMQVNEIEEIPDYLGYLRTHPGEAGALLQDLLISVTNFFRDREAFAALEQRIPELFKGKGPNDTVRVWVAACATGEEAYSIAILLCEYARQLEAAPTIQVFATDLHDEAIQEAREGVYPATIVADVSEDRLRRFFTKEHRGYRVRHEIREVILFALHDLLKDSPFSRLDLISCRNVMIYLNREAQTRVYDIFHFALRSEGLLFLGSSEALDEAVPLFTVLDKKHRLYRHRPMPRIGLPVPSGTSTLARALAEQDRAKQGPVTTRRPAEESLVAVRGRGEPGADRAGSWTELHFKLIESLAPPSVVVDSQLDILHLSERAGRFLQFGGGEPSRNLLKVVHPMLRMDLRAVVYRAMQSSASAEVLATPLELDGETFQVAIRVTPVRENGHELLLVLFDSRPVTGGVPAAKEAARTDPENDSVSRHLERELEQIKTHLRDTVEQYEASTEELKASNEELQAMNEELRSATEELETSREELQSINEELTTVNQELKNKVEELGHTNSALHNLMAATAIATVFLDRDFRITRYTPMAVSLFNLIPTDIGRPLTDLTHHLDYPEMRWDAGSVLEQLVPVEREIAYGVDRWFLARILPYRTTDDRIAGVVLTFVDISERKRAGEALSKSEAAFRAVFELSSVGMLEADPQSGRLTNVNRRLSEILGASQEDLKARTIRDLVGSPDPVGTDAQIGRLLRGEVPELAGELQLVHHGGGLIWCDVNFTVFRDSRGESTRIAAVVVDVTDRKRAEEDLRSSEEQLRRSNVELDERVAERTQKLTLSERHLTDMVALAESRAEQMRSLATDLSRAEQQERKRIAYELHDQIQQILVAAKMRIEMIGLDRRTEQLPQQIRTAAALVDEAIDATRALAVELAPPILGEIGLSQGLEWLASRFAEQHDLVVDLDLQEEANPKSEAMRDLLFRIARELLLNVSKHSGTKTAAMTLRLETGQIVLAVQDEGAGFDIARLAVPSPTFGLLDMRVRLEQVGGTLRIDSATAKGTRVVATVPKPGTGG